MLAPSAPPDPTLVTVIAGRHLSLASGAEYTYTLSVRPGGKEIWTAHVFRDSRLVSTLARGLVERELELDAAHVTELVRSLVVQHIESLP